MAERVLCFGEILLRLSAPAGELLLQGSRLDAHFGGAEANVAVSLARLGHAAAMAGVLPDDALGHAARDALRRHGVDTSRLRVGDGRMGLYFYTHGAGARAGEVLYDRAGSAFALATPAGYDWPALLAGARLLHLSGITPALGPATAQAALDAARAARAAGATISFDGNYRARLWAAWDGEPRGILRALLAETDIAFADHRDIQLVLGLEGDPALAPADRFAAAAQAAFAAFPQLQRIACTARAQGGDGHRLGALLATRDGALHAREGIALGAVVDRIGTGDAFAAGVLHGLLSGMDDAASLAFGQAAACLKHSIAGDANLVSVADVLALAGGERVDVRR